MLHSLWRHYVKVWEVLACQANQRTDYLPIEPGNKAQQLSLPIVKIHLFNLSVELSNFSRLNRLTFDKIRIGSQMYTAAKVH